MKAPGAWGWPLIGLRLAKLRVRLHYFVAGAGVCELRPFGPAVGPLLAEVYGGVCPQCLRRAPTPPPRAPGQ